jgi:hypothetical protein
MSTNYTTEALYPSHSFTDLIFKNHAGINKGFVFLSRMDLAQYSYVRMKSKVSAETVDLNLTI